MAIKVAIIDDSLLVRGMLIRALNLDSRIDVIGEATNGDEGIDLIRSKNPDVVTLDLEMSGSKDGIKVLMVLRQESIGTKVIVLSAVTQPDSVKERACYNLGAFMVLAKPNIEQSFDVSGVENIVLKAVLKAGGIDG